MSFSESAIPLRADMFSEFDADRFWSCVTRLSEDECWDWSGTLTDDGYGRFRANGRSYRANRVAYALAEGEIVQGVFACHRCDRPICCNPDHLFPGTHIENVADMLIKGRGRAPAGEHHVSAKLTEDQAREILRRLSEGERADDLASEYGVSHPTVINMQAGRKWRHLLDVERPTVRAHRKLTDEDVAAAMARHAAGESYAAIATGWGLDRTTITARVRRLRPLPAGLKTGAQLLAEQQAAQAEDA
jgi:hypothetical protein